MIKQSSSWIIKINGKKTSLEKSGSFDMKHFCEKDFKLGGLLVVNDRTFGNQNIWAVNWSKVKEKESYD